MPDQNVTPLRPRAPSAYSDAAALNDIHALLTARDPGEGTLTDIALILGRTGRPMVAARDIEVTTTETVLGWPAASVQSGDTTVLIRQDPAGAGLLIEITTSSAAEHDGLTVTPAALASTPATPPDQAAGAISA